MYHTTTVRIWLPLFMFGLCSRPIDELTHVLVQLSAVQKSIYTMEEYIHILQGDIYTVEVNLHNVAGSIYTEVYLHIVEGIYLQSKGVYLHGDAYIYTVEGYIYTVEQYTY